MSPPESFWRYVRRQYDTHRSFLVHFLFHFFNFGGRGRSYGRWPRANISYRYNRSADLPLYFSGEAHSKVMLFVILHMHRSIGPKGMHSGTVTGRENARPSRKVVRFSSFGMTVARPAGLTWSGLSLRTSACSTEDDPVHVWHAHVRTRACSTEDDPVYV